MQSNRPTTETPNAPAKPLWCIAIGDIKDIVCMTSGKPLLLPEEAATTCCAAMEKAGFDAFTEPWPQIAEQIEERRNTANRLAKWLN